MPAAVSALAALRYEGPPPERARLAQGRTRVWETEAIDALAETVITRVLVEGVQARAVAIELAAGLAVDHPDLPALALALPFTLAAAAIEDMLGGGAEARAAALDAWRVAALIGADALALGGHAAGQGSVAALWAQWQAGDEVFTTDPQ